MVSGLSPPCPAPLLPNVPALLLKVSPRWKLIPPPSLPSASSSHPSCRPQRDTSARWVSPRRTRWPPADTWRWPPSPARGRPRLNFSCKKSFIWLTQIRLWNRCSHRPAACGHFTWLQTISWGTWVLLWNPWPRWFSLAPDLERSHVASLSENQMTNYHMKKSATISALTQTWLYQKVEAKKTPRVCTVDQWFSTGGGATGPTFIHHDYMLTCSEQFCHPLLILTSDF